MGIFRSISKILRVVDEDVNVRNENRDPICDALGAVWVRNVGSEVGPFPVTTSHEWRSIVIAQSWGSLAGLVDSQALLRRIIAISGDPAVSFSAAPVWFQLHWVDPILGAIPEYVWPVTPPPGFLDISIEQSYILAGDNVSYLRWGFSSTRDTFTAGPTGNVMVNRALSVPSF